MITAKLTNKIQLDSSRRTSRSAVLAQKQENEPAPRVPRITKLMALAIKFDQMIRDGVVKDQAEIARLGLVTRARVTQIMNLLNLATTIQEQLLNLSPATGGRDAITEREIRPLLEHQNWSHQIQVQGTMLGR